MSDMHQTAQPVALRPNTRDWTLTTIKVFVFYFIISIATLPFVDALWLGELPVLAVPQLPKLLIAGWFRTGVIMPAISALGLSSGSFSSDYLMARPYALALAYLIPVITVPVVARGRMRVVQSYRSWTFLFLCIAVLDYLLTLRLTHTPGLSLF